MIEVPGYLAKELEAEKKAKVEEVAQAEAETEEIVQGDIQAAGSDN